MKGLKTLAVAGGLTALVLSGCDKEAVKNIYHQGGFSDSSVDFFYESISASEDICRLEVKNKDKMVFSIRKICDNFNGLKFYKDGKVEIFHSPFLGNPYFYTPHKTE
jgi:hypothetical protein